MTETTGTGTFQHLSADRVQAAQDAFEKRVRDAAKFHRHVWITTVAHSMTEQQARSVLDGTAGDRMLSAETVAVTGIGCYACEQGLDATVIDQPCPGEPAPSEAEVLGAIQAALRAGDLRGAMDLTRVLATINPDAAQQIVDTIRRAARP